MTAGRVHPTSTTGDKQREPLLQPVVPRTITDQVAEQLRQLINSGEYKPGDRIPSERDLASRLGVGRPAVREALRELKAQGLLVVGPGRSGDQRRQPPLAQLRRSAGFPSGRGRRAHGRAHGDPQRGGDRGGRPGRPPGDHRGPAPPVRSSPPAPGEMLSPDDDVAFHAAIAAGHPQPAVRAGHPGAGRPAPRPHGGHPQRLLRGAGRRRRPAAAARGHPAGHPGGRRAEGAPGHAPPPGLRGPRAGPAGRDRAG